MTLCYILWFCILIVRAIESINVCCPQNASISEENKCTNEENHLNLNCSDGTIYLLDRTNPQDYFTIDETNEHLQFENISLDPTQYCINLLEVKNSTHHEVALVCIQEFHEELEETLSIIPIMMFLTMEALSIAFLIIIIITYLLLPEIRDLQGMCVLHFLINYSLLHIIINTLHYHNSLSCVIKAYSFYFFSFCAFFWLCISSFNVWRSLKRNDEYPRTYTFYLLFAYGLPVIMLFSILLIQAIPGNHLKPDFNEINCWFKEHASRWWYYYMPVAVLLLLNIFFLTDTGRRIHLIKLRINMHRVKATKTKCILYSKLSAIVGITWILEILCNEAFPSFTALIYVTDVLNCLQGFLIFIILIVTRNKALKCIAKRKPCGMDCLPNSWMTLVDEENEEENRNRYHKITGKEFIEIPLKTIN